MKNGYDVITVGGGAAGFFAAIHAAAGGTNKVLLLEKTAKLLVKVAISGGGRCNVTHACTYPSQLVKHYPRGGKSLRKGFEQFGPSDTVKWFASRGVQIKTEADGRMFPTTDDSATIVDCLLSAAHQAGVEVQLRSEVQSVAPQPGGGFRIALKGGQDLFCRKAIITTGGSNKPEGYHFLKDMGIDLVAPVPSLFTFNVPDSDLKDLMGLSVPHAVVQIPGSKWKEDGPLLITHWGFSAPAVIKLSAWAAADLHARGYHFPILIDWTGQGEAEVRKQLQEARAAHPRRQVSGHALFDIPSRLWERLCAKNGITADQRYADLPAKSMNRLVETLVRSAYAVRGKTTFKEEFVTCGGVALSEVTLPHFESRKYPGLYFAGEVLNVDGVTGGFNFQHAWTSGYLAGTAAAI